MEPDSTEELYGVAAYIYSLISPRWIRAVIVCEMILLSLFLLSSEHHFSGLDDQIIILNVLTRQLLHSLFFWLPVILGGGVIKADFTAVLTVNHSK